MFERYTEKARRVIFFARYEASQFGSPYIETEHLLLGWLREDQALAHRLLPSPTSAESIRKRIEEITVIREKVSTSVDLPLSNESKRVLAYAADESDELGHKHIGTEHLLLGLLHEEKFTAASLLKESGLNLQKAREIIVASVLTSPPVQTIGDPTRIRTGHSIEFVCGDDLIAVFGAPPHAPIPRIGEEVMFKNRNGEDVSYQVENVTYVFSGYASDTATAYQASRVIVEIRRA